MRPFFSYEALASPFLNDLSFHFLGDGEGLVDEAVGQLLHLGFGQDEAEVVLAVATEGEGAVVLAEDGCVVFLLGAFGDVDVAVAHALDAAVGEEGFHLDALGAHEVEGVESVVGRAEGHQAVDHCRHLGFGFVCFHCQVELREKCQKGGHPMLARLRPPQLWLILFFLGQSFSQSDFKRFG